MIAESLYRGVCVSRGLRSADCYAKTLSRLGVSCVRIGDGIELPNLEPILERVTRLHGQTKTVIDWDGVVVPSPVQILLNVVTGRAKEITNYDLFARIVKLWEIADYSQVVVSTSRFYNNKYGIDRSGEINRFPFVSDGMVSELECFALGKLKCATNKTIFGRRGAALEGVVEAGDCNLVVVGSSVKDRRDISAFLLHNPDWADRTYWFDAGCWLM